MYHMHAYKMLIYPFSCSFIFCETVDRLFPSGKHHIKHLFTCVFGSIIRQPPDYYFFVKSLAAAVEDGKKKMPALFQVGLGYQTAYIPYVVKQLGPTLCPSSLSIAFTSMVAGDILDGSIWDSKQTCIGDTIAYYNGSSYINPPPIASKSAE